MSKKTNALTEGPITWGILLFALPILFGNAFQQLYNIVDTAIIGNILGDISLAAIGATSALYTLVISFSNGFTNGFSVVVARFYGAKDEKGVRESVALIYVLTLVIAAVLTMGSLLGLHGILMMLNTPEKIIAETESYLRVILGFATITMLFNMFSGILRAIGNSRVPLCFLFMSSMINVPLDYVLVKYTGLGINGAAYATVIAQVISVILCAIYIWVKYPLLKFSGKDLHYHPAMIRELMSMGFSMAIMIVVISIGSVALQSAVNSLGEKIIAAHSAARKINDMFIWPLGALFTVAATYTSQNLGAGKYDRIRLGMKRCMQLSYAWAVLAFISIYLFGTVVIRVLTGSSDPEIIGNASMYMRINAIFFIPLAYFVIYRSGLQGVGRKIIPVMGSVMECILKFTSVGLIMHYLGYLGVALTEPIIWCIGGVFMIVDYNLYLKQLKKEGKLT